MHPLVESFTVGKDWRYDNHLLHFDCVATIAHAQTLVAIDILSEREYALLAAALRRIIAERRAGAFAVTADYEDCHTAIESRLTAECGEAGKKIHSGRSRNDQVLCALLLYGRQQLFDIVGSVLAVADALLTRAKEEEHTPMMGRTHLQNAMPSTVGVWAAAYAEQLMMLCEPFDALYRVINRSPLGSAAGYGVPLPLDRHRTAHLLAFDEPHQVVLAAANSRGHWEAHYVDSVSQVMMIISRIAADLMLFTLPEIGYMRLPPNLCTGSSIMPHKRNPDVLELMRAKAATVIGASAQIKQIMHALPAGYNRDVQEIKGLLIDSVQTVRATLSVTLLLVQSVEIDRERLRTSIDPRIYSVDHALRLVREQGMSFRDAYGKAAEQSADASAATDAGAATAANTSAATAANTTADAGAATAANTTADVDYAALIAARSSFGAPGNLQLPVLRQRIDQWRQTWNRKQKTVDAQLARVVDGDTMADDNAMAAMARAGVAK